MTADQPLTCPTCHGVTAGASTAAYTPSRGRLIITNGYCRGDCSDPAPRSAGRDPAPDTVLPELTTDRPVSATASRSE